MKNKKLLFLLLLLLLIVIFILFYFFLFSNKSELQNQGKKFSDSESQTATDTNAKTEPEEIIKCQNVVVTPGKTVELFTYVSGKTMKADYRVAARTEEEAVNSQILYDGEWLYVWSNPNRYDTVTKVENPPGLKMKTSAFELKIPSFVKGQVERFGAGQFSGDRLCNDWDDVDPVFEVPSDFVFNETADTAKKVQGDIANICTVCEKSVDETAKTSCRQNLGC